MSGRVDTSVLMVTWNSADVLPVSLAALVASDPGPSELVVLDNASADQSAAIVEAFANGAPFPIKVIRSDQNVGFAAGMNRAIEVATSPSVLLLNPDVRVAPSMVGRLHDAMNGAPEAVYAVGPKLLRASGSERNADRHHRFDGHPHDS